MGSIGPRSSTPYNGHVSQKLDTLGHRKVLGVNGLAPRETAGKDRDPVVPLALARAITFT